MINLKKNLVFILFVIFISISGCKGKNDAQKSIEELNTGTQGVVISFLTNNPPSVIHADQKQFDVVLELNNKGVYPQLESQNVNLGKVYLSGYDPNILIFDQKSFDVRDSRSRDNLDTLHSVADIETVKYERKRFPFEREEQEYYSLK